MPHASLTGLCTHLTGTAFSIFDALFSMSAICFSILRHSHSKTQHNSRDNNNYAGCSSRRQSQSKSQSQYECCLTGALPKIYIQYLYVCTFNVPQDRINSQRQTILQLDQKILYKSCQKFSNLTRCKLKEFNYFYLYLNAHFVLLCQYITGYLARPLHILIVRCSFSPLAFFGKHAL